MKKERCLRAEISTFRLPHRAVIGLLVLAQSSLSAIVSLHGHEVNCAPSPAAPQIRRAANSCVSPSVDAHPRCALCLIVRSSAVRPKPKTLTHPPGGGSPLRGAGLVAPVHFASLYAVYGRAPPLLNVMVLFVGK